MWEIVRACIWQKCENGEEIIVEGDIDDSFYIIVSGSVQVSKGGHSLSKLIAGDCFGEMGYLEKTERTATSKALEAVQLMKINATLIDQVSMECQLKFSKIFLKTLVRRLSNTNSMVVSGPN